MRGERSCELVRDAERVVASMPRGVSPGVDLMRESILRMRDELLEQWPAER